MRLIVGLSALLLLVAFSQAVPHQTTRSNEGDSHGGSTEQYQSGEANGAQTTPSFRTRQDYTGPSQKTSNDHTKRRFRVNSPLPFGAWDAEDDKGTRTTPSRYPTRKDYTGPSQKTSNDYKRHPFSGKAPLPVRSRKAEDCKGMDVTMVLMIACCIFVTLLILFVVMGFIMYRYMRTQMKGRSNQPGVIVTKNLPGVEFNAYAMYPTNNEYNKGEAATEDKA